MTLIRPAHGEICQFDYGLTPAGKSRHCQQKATMLLDSKPLCDQHATIAMITACGRAVQIKRGE